MTNKLDQFYRSLVLSKYFTKGWGKSENLKRICEFRKVVSNRESCYNLVSPDYPVYIEREIDGGNYNLFDGYFFTPLVHYLPEVVPEECRKAYFQLMLPKKWQSENYKPVVLQIAGTGDQYYWRRKNLFAKPLLKEAGIGSIILENPFYGKRRPHDQRRTVLHNVTDIFVMGGCLILESLVLFHFCERLGYGPLGVTGLSMGGHMASLAATCWPKPIVVIPCLSGLTASNVFTQGVISQALNWDLLEKQFHSDSIFEKEIFEMINVSKGNAFKAGQDFVKNMSEPNYDICGGEIPINVDDLSNSSQYSTLSKNSQTEKSSIERNLSQSNVPLDMFTVSDNKVYLHSSGEGNLKNLTDSNSLSFKKFSEAYESSRNIDGENVKTSDTPKDESTLNAIAGNIYNSDLKSRKNSAHSILENSLLHLNSFIKLTKNIVKNDIDAQNVTNDVDLLGTIISKQQAINFMNGIMDECTHLKNYPAPVDTSLVIAVCAEDDAYVPLKGVSRLDEIWPGAEVRFVKGGHVRAYIQCQRQFRSAIIDAFSRYRSKYLKVCL